MFGSKGVIGLDIGSSYIKVVQLNVTRSGYELELFDTIALLPELIVDGSIIDSFRLVESLSELIKKAKIKVKDTVISVAGHSSVIVKRITLPEMTEDELAESIKFEAEQYVPFDIEDVNIDFQIIGPRDERGQMDVILVAVKKEFMNEYISVVKEVGLNPLVVDVNVFALENMYGINYEIEADSNVALVNIGASSINLNIVRGGVSVFTRESPVGSDLHTEALRKEFKISHEEAERIKRGEEAVGVSPDEAYHVIAESSGEICSEVSRALDYFRAASAQSYVKEMILSGGCALVRDFPRILSDKIGIDVRLAEPFRNIKIPKRYEGSVEYMAPIAAVAVGLAMRRPGDR